MPEKYEKWCPKLRKWCQNGSLNQRFVLLFRKRRKRSKLFVLQQKTWFWASRNLRKINHKSAKDRCQKQTCKKYGKRCQNGAEMGTKMAQKFDFGGLGVDFEELEIWRIFRARKMEPRFEKKRIFDKFSTPPNKNNKLCNRPPSKKASKTHRIYNRILFFDVWIQLLAKIRNK